MKEKIQLGQLEGVGDRLYATDQYGRLWCMDDDLYLVEFEDITKYEWAATE